MINQKIQEIKKMLSAILSDEEATHGLSRACRRLQKEITIFENHTKSKVVIRGNNNEMNTEKIQIGGGSHTLDGYLNIDVFEPADMVWDVREGLPLPDECSNQIFSEHFLEHIDYPVSAKRFVTECYRVLKPSGELIVGVPDGKLILDKYQEKDKEFFDEMIEKWYAKRNCLNDFNTYIDLVNYHFRDQDDDEKYTTHLWTYDFEKITSMMRGAGFSNVKKWDFDDKIANPKREWGSLYVIAKK
jgi:predicted SAM-dependent methyltransferase